MFALQAITRNTQLRFRRNLTMLQKQMNISMETLYSCCCIFVSNCLKKTYLIKLHILDKTCTRSAITLPHSKQIRWYFIRHQILITWICCNSSMTNYSFYKHVWWTLCCNEFTPCALYALKNDSKTCICSQIYILNSPVECFDLTIAYCL